ncbi:MAG: hypothetical protein ACOCX4_03115, partial [Planctomycetota bacterium]
MRAQRSIWLVAVCMIACSVAVAGEDGGVFALAVTEAEIDFEATRHFHDGKEGAPGRDKVLLSMGLLAPSKEVDNWHRKWSAGRAGGRHGEGDKLSPEPEVFHYRVAFKRPVAVGSVLFSNRELRVLKPDAPYPGDPDNPEHWQEIDIPPRQWPFRLAALPVGTETRAILLTDRMKSGTSTAHPVQVYRRRLHNVSSSARVRASSQYNAPRAFGERSYPPIGPVRGRGTWLSNGKNDEGNIAGPYISEVEPAWYVLAWDEPQPVAGLIQVDNFKRIAFDHFEGPASANPLIGVDEEWDPVRTHELVENRIHGRSDFGRWISFAEPIGTRGIRERILGAWVRDGGDSQVASLSSLLVVRDLGDAPVPEAPDDGPPKPPYKIPYALERDRDFFTLVVNGPDGRRLRNLVAR